MSHVRPRFRHLLLAAALALGGALTPSTSSASERIETIDVPSAQGNVDPTRVKLNKVSSLQATVLLPDGYDADPQRQWPVLYLLAGIGDNHTGWITSGQAPAILKDLPAIVVLPESGRGFLMDWWKADARAAGQWSSYTLGEVIPAVHARYRVRPGRQHHSIAGISSGGYGALLLAGQLPGYFGSVVALSPLVDPQSLDSAALLPSETGATGYDAIWGPIDGPYASVSNPLKVADNLADSRVYLHTGDGRVDPGVPFNFDAWTKGVIIEVLAKQQNVRYDAALTKAGVDHVFRVRVGVHEWAYWRRELPLALQWGLFAPLPAATQEAATRWTYKTMATHGNAWGLGFTFPARPKGIVTLSRAGLTVTGHGAGTITIDPGAAESDASGAGTKPACSFTAELPFTKTLSAECLSS